MVIQSKESISHSVRRLNHLAKHLHAKRYLELGVETGATFHNIECQWKIAVDPRFCFDSTTESELNIAGHCEYHETESDLFFRNIDKNHAPFDLVFIDGLHHYDQVMRDFINSIRYSHPKTAYLIDDTLPCDAFSSMRDQQQAMGLRRRFSSSFKSNAWHGDVYLFVILLPLYFPSYRYRTIVDGMSNPQTIIWLDTEESEVDEWTQTRSLWASQNLSSCNYLWLLENIDMLRPAGEIEALSLILSRL